MHQHAHPAPRPTPAVDGRTAADVLEQGIGRRRLLAAAAGLTAAGAVAAGSVPAASAAAKGSRTLHSHRGPWRGTYVPLDADTALWGRLPTRDTEPVAVVDSGTVVTIDTLSHEGILEDQGKDPMAYFTDHGVAPWDVLDDAVEVAARTPHDGPGPHVITGPIAVRGAEPGDVLKVDVLSLDLRVPYGVISNRHGKGALPGEYPERWVGTPELEEYFNVGGQISVFTHAERRGDQHVGVLPGTVDAAFPLAPFLGTMGVARDTTAVVDSVPPTDAGGNLDINDLTAGSTLYLPIRVPGAKFFAGDPHMAQGDGEVALTAMEGSLRASVRLSVVRPGSGGAPRQTATHPFAETSEHWIPIGLSDVDGPGGGANTTDLGEAMKAAVRHAMAFLTEDLGMAGPVAYAYLSAAADFQVSQVVDRTTGVHGLIRKADFGR